MYSRQAEEQIRMTTAYDPRADWARDDCIAERTRYELGIIRDQHEQRTSKILSDYRDAIAALCDRAPR